MIINGNSITSKSQVNILGKRKQQQKNDDYL